MDPCFENRFVHAACYKSYEYLQNVLYDVDNCLTGSINWSLDGRYLKINYRQFESEYLSAGPLKSEDVFSFIRQVERCGFRHVSDSCDSMVDELIFIRLDYCDALFHQWRDRSSCHEKSNHNNHIFTEKNRAPESYFPRSREDHFDVKEFFHFPKNAADYCEQENFKYHQQVDTVSGKRTTSLPKHFLNYHLEFPGVKSRDSTLQCSPNGRSRREAYEQQKLSPANWHRQNDLNFRHCPIFPDPLFEGERILHFQNAANHCELENSKYHQQAHTALGKRTTRVPKHFLNYHLEFPGVKSRDSTPQSSPNGRSRIERYEQQKLSPTNWHRQNNLDLGHCSLFQDPCLEDERILRFTNHCELQNSKYHHQVDTASGKGTPRTPKHFLNYHLQFPGIKSQDSTPKSSPSRRRGRRRTKLFPDNGHQQGELGFEHCPIFQDPEYRIKIMLYEDDDDTSDVFIRETSGDVMLSEGLKIDFTLSQVVDQKPTDEKFKCICPKRIAESLC